MSPKEIILKLIGSIASEALKRPVKSIVDKFSRQKIVNRAFVSGTLGAPERQDNVYPTIESDIIHVIGNDYTESVIRFLSEIEKSSIPDTMRQIAICGNDPKVLLPSFNYIYKRYEPLPFDSESLFSALYAAIQTKIQQSLTDRGVLSVIQGNKKEIIDHINAVTRNLSRVNEIKTIIPTELFVESRQRIAKGIENFNKNIQIETSAGAKKININRMIVSSRLVPFEKEGKYPYAHRDSENLPTGSELKYLTFRRTFVRSVILGDPGGGKSTLTQLLCHDLAAQVVLESQPGNSRLIDSRDLCIPLRVVLRSLERRQIKNPSYTIFDYLVDDIKGFLDNDESLSSIVLKELLTFGQAVMLFDGLDEVLDIESRRTAAAQIESFCETYAGCPCLVTSRLVGYKDAPLNDSFQTLGLARFNEDEIKKYSENLIKAVNRIKTEDAKALAKTFISQTEAIAADLRENPLMLGLMVYIFSNRGDVPNNRPEIYKECSLLMFEKWDQRRGIHFALPRDFDLLDLFGFLALNVFGDPAAEDGVSEDWLLQKLKKFFDGWYANRAKSVEASRILIDFITGRAWVMCEVGHKVFKFTHRTFLEYFFARRIEEEAGSVPALLKDFLLERVREGQWQVVSDLSLQIATFRSGPKSLQAIDTMEDILDLGFEHQNHEFEFLSFCCRCLGYLTISESRLQKFASIAIDRIIHLGSSFNVESREILHLLLMSSGERRPLVNEIIANRVSTILKGGKGAKRTFALFLVGTRHAGFTSLRRRWDPGVTELIWTALRHVRENFEPSLHARAVKDPREAAAYFFIYKQKIVELYKLHRSSMILISSNELIPSAMKFTIFEIIENVSIALTNSRAYESGLDLSRSSAKTLISLIADDVIEISKNIDVEFGDRIFRIQPFVPVFARIASGHEKRNKDDQLKAESECIYCCLVLLAAARSEKINKIQINKKIKQRVYAFSDANELLLDQIQRFSDQPLFENIKLIISQIEKERLSQGEKETYKIVI